jgi:hypothetical protein
MVQLVFTDLSKYKTTNQSILMVFQIREQFFKKVLLR